MNRKAFSMIELLIVVAILGILAAVITPSFQGHIQQAKEAAAKDNLRILRGAIERYAYDHGGVAPGYANDDISSTPSYMAFSRALTEINHYLSDIPENPFNDLANTQVLASGATFPSAAENTGSYGWIYQPESKEIKLNWSGADSAGVNYFDY